MLDVLIAPQQETLLACPRPVFRAARLGPFAAKANEGNTIYRKTFKPPFLKAQSSTQEGLR